MKNKIIGLLIIMISFIAFIPTAYAGSLSVSTSSKSVTIGGSVTITVKATGLAGKFKISSSDGSVLAGGNNGIWIENQSKTFKFTAKKVGTANIVVTPITVGDLDNNGKYTTSKSVTINVVKPREKSTNNNLKSLSVEGYTLSPTFNKNTLEYTVNLDSNVETIKINATKEDSYASLLGTGEKQVQEGDNKFEIKVTSETGSSKVYTVNAIVKDSNPIVKKIDGKNYTVIKRTSTLKQPDFFEPTTVTINELEIPAFYNEVTNTTLIGVKDEEGNTYLYKYDKKTADLSKYESLTSTSKTIIFENTKEEVEGYTETKVTIDNNEYNAYQHKDNKDYVLIYGMDIETGEKNWYLYNIKEKSLQTYMSDIVDNLSADFNKIIDEYKVVLLGMAGLSLLLLLIVVIQIISKNKMKKKLLKELQQKQEKMNKKTNQETKVEKQKKNK